MVLKLSQSVMHTQLKNRTLIITNGCCLIEPNLDQARTNLGRVGVNLGYRYLNLNKNPVKEHLNFQTHSKL